MILFGPRPFPFSADCAGKGLITCSAVSASQQALRKADEPFRAAATVLFCSSIDVARSKHLMQPGRQHGAASRIHRHVLQRWSAIGLSCRESSQLAYVSTCDHTPGLLG